MYMYLFIYMYICIYVYTYIHTYKCIYIPTPGSWPPVPPLAFTRTGVHAPPDRKMPQLTIRRGTVAHLGNQGCCVHRNKETKP